MLVTNHVEARISANLEEKFSMVTNSGEPSKNLEERKT